MKPMLRLACLTAALAAAPAWAQPTPENLLRDAPAARRGIARFHSGQQLLQQGHFEPAIAEFRDALAADPLLASAHYAIGEAYMRLRRYPDAAQAFLECRATFERLAAMQAGARAAIEARVSDQIQALRRVRESPSSRGPAIGRQDRIRTLERVRRRPGDTIQSPPEVALALGSAYFRNGQTVNAEREWRHAVTVAPDLGEAHNNLAVIYMMTGRKKEAENAVRAAEKAGFRVSPQLKTDIGRLDGRP